MISTAATVVQDFFTVFLTHAFLSALLLKISIIPDLLNALLVLVRLG